MKILIIQTSAIGDIIYTLYNIKFIKHNFPDAEIDWIVKNKNIILENQKCINKIFYHNNMIKDIYDYIIDFGTKRSTLYLKYSLSGTKIGFVANKKKYISFFNDYSIKYNNNIAVMENQLNILKFICKLENKSILLNHTPTIDFNKKIIKDIKKYEKELTNIVILNPNSSKSYKEFSIDQWINILENLNKNDSNIMIGEHFGEKGKDLSIIIKKKYPYIKILPKNLDNLYNLSYLISKSKLVYTPDTSILHLAEFYKIKIVYFFIKKSNIKVKEWYKIYC